MAQNSFIESGKIRDFQGKLKQLADNLMELHDTLEHQLSTLHEEWDDPKYQEFVDDFERDKHHIVEVSKAFTDEVTVKLQRKYEDALAMENVR
jgi:hexokinase